MIDTRASVSQFKARLSEYIAESRRTKKRLIVTSRNKAIAILTPIDDSGAGSTATNGLASLAGDWKDIKDTAAWIEGAFGGRESDGYR
jgi:prevent-host-death family protein